MENKAASKVYPYIFQLLAGSSKGVRKLLNDRPDIFDYRDYPEYTVAINNGKCGEQYKGDRIVCSHDDSFHMLFRKADGFTAKWGAKSEDNPTHCPWGNEIADIEITTSCAGIRDKEGNRMPCAFCCTPDTMIRMADGTEKRIDEVKVGDKVLSYHEGQLAENTVKEVYSRDYWGKVIGGYAKYVDRRKKPGYHVLPRTTPEHPYMMREGNDYIQIPAEDMRSHWGDEILFDNNQDGYFDEMETETYDGKVYNFHCIPDEMYFADGVLVHNCYKANTADGTYMPLETFQKVFDLMAQTNTLTQIAFGVDAQCKGNPDVWRIMDYTLEHGVIPNVTVADIDQETAESIVKRCGACSVSAYQRDKNRCYDSVKLLTEEAKRQGRKMAVNIHLLVSAETADFCWEVINDIRTDERLKDLHAVVLLSLKQKGRGKAFHRMDSDIRRKIVNHLLDNGIPFGMDSCGANSFLETIKDREDYKRLEEMVEPCEACMMSGYVNVEGKMYPCSFMEGEGEWKDGIDLTNGDYNDYTEEVWNHPRIVKWRVDAVKCIECNGCNQCPYYNI